MVDANVAADPNHTPRAINEPAVNKWLASVLPLPEKVLCKISYSSLIANEPDIKVSLKDLGLQPIDLLYILDMDTEQAMTSLDDKISNYVRYTLSKHANTEITINYTEVIDKNDRTKISFFL